MAAASEARRHEMYNELARVIGIEPADTLMAYLPTNESAALATKADIVDLRAATKRDMDHLEMRLATRIDGLDGRIDGIDGRIDGLDSRMGRFENQLDGVNQRLDRLFLMLGAGLITIVGSLIVAYMLG